MVSVPAVNPPGEGFRDFAYYGREVLEPLGFRVVVVEGSE